MGQPVYLRKLSGQIVKRPKPRKLKVWLDDRAQARLNYLCILWQCGPEEVVPRVLQVVSTIYRSNENETIKKESETREDGKLPGREKRGNLPEQTGVEPIAGIIGRFTVRA